MIGDESHQNERDRLCANCGAALEPNTNFCGDCGQAIQAIDEIGPAETASGGYLPLRDLGQRIGRTLVLIREHITLFTVLGFATQVPILIWGWLVPLPELSQGFPIPSESGIETLPEFPLTVLWSLIPVFVTTMVLSLLAQGTMVVVTAWKQLGVSPSISACLAHSFRRLGVLFLSWICLTIAIFLLFIPVALVSMIVPMVGLLLIVPLLLFLLVSLWFFPQAVMIENQGPVAALLRSRELVRGDWWRVFGTGVVYLLIYGFAFSLVLIITIPIGLLSPELAEMVVALFNAVSTPWFYVGSTLLYLDLRSRKESCTLEQLASDLTVPDSPKDVVPY